MRVTAVGEGVAQAGPGRGQHRLALAASVAVGRAAVAAIARVSRAEARKVDGVEQQRRCGPAGGEEEAADQRADRDVEVGGDAGAGCWRAAARRRRPGRHRGRLGPGRRSSPGSVVERQPGRRSPGTAAVGPAAAKIAAWPSRRRSSAAAGRSGRRGFRPAGRAGAAPSRRSAAPRPRCRCRGSAGRRASAPSAPRRSRRRRGPVPPRGPGTGAVAQQRERAAIR